MARTALLGPVAAALISVAAMAVSPPAFAEEAGSDGRAAVVFIERIYDGYRPGGPKPLDYDGKDAARVFTPAVVALMRRSHAAHGEEPLDWLTDHDLFCACQDFASLRAKVRLQAVKGDRAWVTATVRDTGIKGPPQNLSFELERVTGAWRIADLVDPDTGSLRKALLEDARRFPVRVLRKSPVEPFRAAPRPRTGDR